MMDCFKMFEQRAVSVREDTPYCSPLVEEMFTVLGKDRPAQQRT